MSLPLPAFCCPLCDSPDHALFHQDHRRYHKCARCRLIFVEPGQRLSHDAEKAEYDLHQNDTQDAGYRRFLSRLATPLMARLAPGSEGLDFGCGPGPALAAMLNEAGFAVTTYDPYYANHAQRLQRQYDFVTCTEAIEHFYSPGNEWRRLLAMLRPGGWLGLMTKLARDQAAFATWHYKQDPTHVCFFSRDTFAWLAQRDGLGIEFIGADVILLHKPESL
ncbi:MULTISPECIES: class I SAM-dependent methyltransferase [Oceanimonas]|uniref:2-polyprenyl-3-methyl-5-hydroxy-6-metoxy-1, 4-benzoquinol methylase n=1 Tax=Oceanimonas doudoroffii TaxID=84158 RepID=A0A233RE22_9GAMM|nr:MULTISPECIES: class I SAM-dependent methyltransferase [Oceanimonas]NHH99188.1 Ubiquinone biosynthesis O-methyltransferase [Oceanimonas sp. MB9]OXY81639.1 2-polyprenyl-3-methyl-5-hydroxy-6-metoxy-1,4-benzoquinol methylase [Oceanimonas doudoroffii]